MYTSGRTVKSSKATKSPIRLATAEARRLARKHLPAHAEPIIRSNTIVGLDGVRRMKTEILFCEMDSEISKPLADAVQQLPGYHSMAWNRVAVTYLINL